MEKKKNALVVVAIDFGTTYSGFAYSFKAEYQKDHLQIYSNNNWKSGDGLVTSKTPTVILFDKDGKFSKFGYDAEAKYNLLLDEGNADGWRYFSQFKMKLFRTEQKTLKRTRAGRISRDLMIEDHQNRPMSALKVFAESIRFFIDTFLECQQVRGLNLDPKTDIHWVLTVPAIWTDGAKQFMREAATLAGIDGDMLSLAYEPEAAAIFCKELIVQRKEGTESASLSSFDVGQEFLVLDCGGGTIDVTAYQVQDGGHLKELQPPTGGPWGGTCVDSQYLEFLQLLVGRDVWGEYKLCNAEDVLESQRRFEAKKKSVLSGSDDLTTIPFPISLFHKYESTKHCKSFQDDLQKSCFSKSVSMRKEKLRFENQLVTSFFQQSLDAISGHLKFLLRKTQLRQIKTILMVGGFSDSSVLSERIRNEFKHITVICPNDAVNAIMKGAVIFGHNPYLISERISPRTYGISVNKPFDNRIHPPHLRAEYGNRVMCTDIFQVIVKIGQPIIVGKSIFQHRCLPSHPWDIEATVDIYESKDEIPQYTTDEGVRRLGDVTVAIPDTSKGKNRPIIVQISFGYTELKVQAYEEGTRNLAEVKFNCLNC